MNIGLPGRIRIVRTISQALLELASCIAFSAYNSPFMSTSWDIFGGGVLLYLLVQIFKLALSLVGAISSFISLKVFQSETTIKLVTQMRHKRLPVTENMIYSDDAVYQLNEAVKAKEATRDAISFASATLGLIEGARMFGGVIATFVTTRTVDRALDVYKSEIVRSGALDNLLRDYDDLVP